MRKEKKPFQEKKSKAVHKATAPFGQREPCVSPRRAFASSMRREGRKNPLIHLPFLLGTQCVCACVIFSRIFSCRKYPWEVTNTILEGLWVGAQKGAASDGANQSNKAHGHFSPWRQKRREITRAVSKNSLGIDPLSRWVLWQIPIVGTLQPLPVRS